MRMLVQQQAERPAGVYGGRRTTSGGGSNAAVEAGAGGEDAALAGMARRANAGPHAAYLSGLQAVVHGAASITSPPAPAQAVVQRSGRKVRMKLAKGKSASLTPLYVRTRPGRSAPVLASSDSDEEQELSPRPVAKRRTPSILVLPDSPETGDLESDSEDASSHASVSDDESMVLGNPTRTGSVADPGLSIRQPVHVLRPADPPGEEREVEADELTERVQALRGAYETQRQKPRRIDVKGVAKSTQVPLRDMGLPISGFPSGGLGPTTESQKSRVPPVADYVEMRPMQALSHVSEVLYGAALLAGKKPVEVQAGRAEVDFRSEGDLFLSANDPDTQKWMHGAMGDPLTLLHDLAKLTPEEIAKHGKGEGKAVDRARKSALKILFNEEQKEQRLATIRERFPGSGKRKKRSKLNRDLKRVDEIFDRFLKGDVGIVHNLEGKHAEQNIAAAMYDSGEPYRKGEIAGTKIRCEGCSGELGTNTTDEHGVSVSGKMYAAQAAKGKHAGIILRILSGQHLIAMGSSQRPESPSPLKAASGGKRKLPPVYPKKQKSEKADADVPAKKQKRKASSSPESQSTATPKKRKASISPQPQSTAAPQKKTGALLAPPSVASSSKKKKGPAKWKPRT